MSNTSLLLRRLTAAMMLFGIAAAAHPAAAVETLKIMPLGDSITEGWMASLIGHPEADIAGYRGPLYTKLVAAGYNVQFVGSNTTFPGTLPAGTDTPRRPLGLDDLGRNGRNGIARRTDQPYRHVAGAQRGRPKRHPADDRHERRLVEQSACHGADRLSSLISKISNKTTGLKPNAKLIVAQISPFNDDAQDGRARAYNTGVASVVASHRRWARTSAWSTCTRRSAATTDLSDLVHPNASGYNKIADVWFQGIKAAVPEPSAVVLLGTGLLGLAWFTCRNHQVVPRTPSVV